MKKDGKFLIDDITHPSLILHWNVADTTEYVHFGIIALALSEFDAIILLCSLLLHCTQIYLNSLYEQILQMSAKLYRWLKI